MCVSLQYMITRFECHLNKRLGNIAFLSSYPNVWIPGCDPSCYSLQRQEYLTEPLRKISALQAVLELAGNFLTGIEIVLGIYC